MDNGNHQQDIRPSPLVCMLGKQDGAQQQGCTVVVSIRNHCGHDSCANNHIDQGLAVLFTPIRTRILEQSILESEDVQDCSVDKCVCACKSIHFQFRHIPFSVSNIYQLQKQNDTRNVEPNHGSRCPCANRNGQNTRQNEPMRFWNQ